MEQSKPNPLLSLSEKCSFFALDTHSRLMLPFGVKSSTMFTRGQYAAYFKKIHPTYRKNSLNIVSVPQAEDVSKNPIWVAFYAEDTITGVRLKNLYVVLVAHLEDVDNTIVECSKNYKFVMRLQTSPGSERQTMLHKTVAQFYDVCKQAEASPKSRSHVYFNETSVHVLFLKYLLSNCNSFVPYQLINVFHNIMQCDSRNQVSLIAYIKVKNDEYKINQNLLQNLDVSKLTTHFVVVWILFQITDDLCQPACLIYDKYSRYFHAIYSRGLKPKEPIILNVLVQMGRLLKPHEDVEPTNQYKKLAFKIALEITESASLIFPPSSAWSHIVDNTGCLNVFFKAWELTTMLSRAANVPKRNEPRVDFDEKFNVLRNKTQVFLKKSLYYPELVQEHFVVFYLCKPFIGTLFNCIYPFMIEVDVCESVTNATTEEEVKQFLERVYKK